MLKKKPTEEELEIYECFHTPECLAEVLFSDTNNLSLFDKKDMIKLWLSQIPLLSHGIMVADNPNLSQKKNNEQKENVDNLYCYSARNFGKSAITRIDIIISLIRLKNLPMALSSYDLLHVRKMLDPIIDAFTYHPFVSLFKVKLNRGTDYIIQTTNGNTLNGINMAISDGKNAGKNFFGQHFKLHFMEEGSFENDIVNGKRIDSRHLDYCIERFEGMTNFTPYEPAGIVFYDRKNAHCVMNVPTFINPGWGPKQKEKAIKKYKGQGTLGFLMFVLGQIIEDGKSVINMEIVRENCYPKKSDGTIDENRTLKELEIKQKNLEQYENILAVVRPKNAEFLLLAADIGHKGGTTEIGIFSKVDNLYNLLYNITLRNITVPQQRMIFKHLYNKLNIDFISIDCSGAGELFYYELAEDHDIDKDKLIWVSFNENLVIGYETDNKGNIIIEDGKQKEKKVNTVDWSVERLCSLLYSGSVYLPFSYKIDEQLNRVVAMISEQTKRILYKCTSIENHAWQMLQVFAIAEWHISGKDLINKDGDFYDNYMASFIGA